MIDTVIPLSAVSFALGIAVGVTTGLGFGLYFATRWQQERVDFLTWRLIKALEGNDSCTPS